jgi:hypothetical protein
MFVTGSEAVSVTISFMLYKLVLNKDVQDKVREEITVIKKNGGQLSNLIREVDKNAVIPLYCPCILTVPSVEFPIEFSTLITNFRSVQKKF